MTHLSELRVDTENILLSESIFWKFKKKQQSVYAQELCNSQYYILLYHLCVLN